MAEEQHAESTFPVAPMHQFEIERLIPIHLGDLDLSFTNGALWMLITVVVLFMFFGLSMRGRALVPGRMQSCAEVFYELIANLVRDNVGSEGRKYFPFIFSLFGFVLFGNLLSLLPGSFSFTSQIIVTFTMAIVIFISVTVIGFVRHGTGYLRMFFPHGAPLWTAVILVPIEVISYLSRPISLSVRLFANLMSGHILLKVFAGFILMMGASGVIPLLALIGVTALEVLVCCLQAYIFTILTCVYLNDAINMH